MQRYGQTDEVATVSVYQEHEVMETQVDHNVYFVPVLGQTSERNQGETSRISEK